MAEPAVDQLRLLDGAARLRLRAAGAEPAARRRVDRARDVAGQHDPLALALDHRVGLGDRRQQRLRVRVGGRRVQLLGRADLHQLAEVHHGDDVGDVAHDGQVVGDEQVRQVELVLQVLQQVDDAGLDRHVERRHRLVEHDERRVEGQRPGDADALALAAGELVRVAAGVVGRQPDELEQLLDLLVVVAGDLVDLQRLLDRAADGEPRVERGVRVLEDHLHLAAQRPQLLAAQADELAALVLHRPGARLDQLQHAAPERRLARAALADQARASRAWPIVNDTSETAWTSRLVTRRPLARRTGNTLTRSLTSTTGASPSADAFSEDRRHP